MDQSGSILVSTDALTKSFGATEALSKLSFEMRSGEIACLLGPNGAGKTTTLKLLVGLLRPTAGVVRVAGLDPSTRPIDVKCKVGYSSDEPAFYDFLSGTETINFAAEMRGLDRVESWARIDSLVVLLEFKEALSKLVGTYSHGMKKKLSLLLALIHDPPVLLLDEPTNGLDPVAAARMREVLRSRSSAGTAILISTHLLDLAEQLCSRILLLHGGRLVAQGTVGDLRLKAGLADTASLEQAFFALIA